MINANFNTFKFNVSPFNTSYLRILTVSMTSTVTSINTTKIVGTFVVTGSANGVGNGFARLILEVELDGLINIKSEAKARVIRILKVSGNISGVSLNKLELRHFKIMEFLGTLHAGDVVEIDSSEFTFKINGVDSYSSYNGKFINLTKDTRIIYQDNNSSREIELSVFFDEKFL